MQPLTREQGTNLAAAAGKRALPSGTRFGDASANNALSKAFEDDFKKAEPLSLPLRLVILFFAFGAILAAGVPVLLVITAVGTTLGLLGLISHVIPIDEMIGSIVLLIGMAVGVDYALFYLRRERGEGRGPLTARRHQHRRGDLGSRRADLRPDRHAAMAGMLLAGDPTFTKDFNDLMSARAPIVFAFVLTLAFLLLLVTFRSIVIPIKAIVLRGCRRP